MMLIHQFCLLLNDTKNLAASTNKTGIIEITDLVIIIKGTINTMNKKRIINMKNIGLIENPA